MSASTPPDRNVWPRRHLETLFRAGAVGGLSDGELLRRFVDGGGQAAPAFSALVDRHGPLVLQVCRSVTGGEHDALDAFQATFLVLVRRARTVRIGSSGSLAPWLHAVALRTARGARRAALRRRSLDRLAAETGRVRVEATTECGTVDHDLAEMLHAEIDRLPDAFRLAVVLCGLEGLSQAHAADRLGWPLGTLQSRLARGRDRLRQRLERRGVTPATLASAFPVQAALGRLPDTLVTTTTRVATAYVASAGAGAVPAVVAGLTGEIVRTMTLHKLGTSLAAVTLAGSLTAGGLALATRQPDDKPAGPAAAGRVATSSLAPMRKLQPGDRVLIEVLEALPGRPISGTRTVRPDGTISLGFYGDLPAVGLDRVGLKEQVIGLLRKKLGDEVLGLVAMDQKTGKLRPVAPRDSDRVLVDEEIALEERPRSDPAISRAVEALSKKIEILEAALRDHGSPGPAKDAASPARPKTLKPGYYVQVEVLEALPGRPITGIRRIRPDGTLSLGFYGEIPAAGLDRSGLKVKVIEHLQKFLADDVLGLEKLEGDDKIVKVAPGDSDRVFVDDDVTPSDAARAREAAYGVHDPAIESLNAAVTSLQNEIRSKKKAEASATAASRPKAAPVANIDSPEAALSDDRRLDETASTLGAEMRMVQRYIRQVGSQLAQQKKSLTDGRPATDALREEGSRLNQNLGNAQQMEEKLSVLRQTLEDYRRYRMELFR